MPSPCAITSGLVRLSKIGPREENVVAFSPAVPAPEAPTVSAFFARPGEPTAPPMLAQQVPLLPAAMAISRSGNSQVTASASWANSSYEGSHRIDGKQNRPRKQQLPPQELEWMRAPLA